MNRRVQDPEPENFEVEELGALAGLVEFRILHPGVGLAVLVEEADGNRRCRGHQHVVQACNGARIS